MKRYLEPLLGDVPVDAIDADTIRRFQIDVLKQSNSAAATRNAMKLLHNSLNAARVDGLIEAVPAFVHDRYQPAHEPPPSTLTLESVRCQLPTARDKALFSLMAYTGLPPREALALRWGDFDQNYRRLRPVRKYLVGEVQEIPAKAHRGLDVPQVVLDDLNAYVLPVNRTPDAWVFPGAGDKPRSFNSWRTDVWYPACRRAGVELRPAQLRQAYAALLYQEGRTPTHIAAALGATSRTRAYDTFLADLEPPTRTTPLQIAVWRARQEAARRPTGDGRFAPAI